MNPEKWICPVDGTIQHKLSCDECAMGVKPEVWGCRWCSRYQLGPQCQNSKHIQSVTEGTADIPLDRHDSSLWNDYIYCKRCKNSGKITPIMPRSRINRTCTEGHDLSVPNVSNAAEQLRWIWMTSLWDQIGDKKNREDNEWMKQFLEKNQFDISQTHLNPDKTEYDYEDKVWTCKKCNSEVDTMECFECMQNKTFLDSMPSTNPDFWTCYHCAFAKNKFPQDIKCNKCLTKRPGGDKTADIGDKTADIEEDEYEEPQSVDMNPDKVVYEEPQSPKMHPSSEESDDKPKKSEKKEPTEEARKLFQDRYIMYRDLASELWEDLKNKEVNECKLADVKQFASYTKTELDCEHQYKYLKPQTYAFVPENQSHVFEKLAQYAEKLIQFEKNPSESTRDNLPFVFGEIPEFVLMTGGDEIQTKYKKMWDILNYHTTRLLNLASATDDQNAQKEMDQQYQNIVQSCQKADRQKSKIETKLDSKNWKKGKPGTIQLAMKLLLESRIETLDMYHQFITTFLSRIVNGASIIAEQSSLTNRYKFLQQTLESVKQIQVNNLNEEEMRQKQTEFNGTISTLGELQKSNFPMKSIQQNDKYFGILYQINEEFNTYVIPKVVHIIKRKVESIQEKLDKIDLDKSMELHQQAAEQLRQNMTTQQQKSQETEPEITKTEVKEPRSDIMDLKKLREIQQREEEQKAEAQYLINKRFQEMTEFEIPTSDISQKIEQEGAPKIDEKPNEEKKNLNLLVATLVSIVSIIWSIIALLSKKIKKPRTASIVLLVILSFTVFPLKKPLSALIFITIVIHVFVQNITYHKWVIGFDLIVTVFCIIVAAFFS